MDGEIPSLFYYTLTAGRFGAFYRSVMQPGVPGLFRNSMMMASCTDRSVTRPDTGRSLHRRQFLIFADMESGPAKLTFLLFILLALSCFSALQPLHARSSTINRHPVYSFQAHKPFKGELNRVSQPVSASSTSVIREQVEPSALSQPDALHNLALARKILRFSLIPVQIKEYLSHIYPSHNFW